MDIGAILVGLLKGYLAGENEREGRPMREPL